MPNIFFDISGLVLHLSRSDTYSGIQRTLVMAVVETVAQVGAEYVFLSFYDTRKLRYRAISMRLIEKKALMEPRKLRAMLGIKANHDTIFPPLHGYANNSKKYRFHLARFHLNALLRNDGFFRQRNVTIIDWNNHLRAKRQREKAVKGRDFSAEGRRGDHLILLDNSWTVSRSIIEFRKANENGLKVHVMVHDLIPIVRPDLVTEKVSLKLYDWLLSTLDFTIGYLANSQATKNDLEMFLNVHEALKPISVVPLAQDVISEPREFQASGPLAKRVNAKVYPKVLDTIGVQNTIRSLLEIPYVLCVGTLETRKNNWRIALAWQLLRQTLSVDHMPKLVFAGRSGWMNDDFHQLMASTGNLGGFVILIDAPNDAELALLYRHCSFTILASHYEGWGLPVGESLSYGKTAVVADNSSLPEVGGELVLYCDSMSPSSIMEACRNLITEPDQREALENRIRSTKLRSWADVARDLIAATMKYDGKNSADENA